MLGVHIALEMTCLQGSVIRLKAKYKIQNIYIYTHSHSCISTSIYLHVFIEIENDELTLIPPLEYLRVHSRFYSLCATAFSKSEKTGPIRLDILI